MHRFFALESMIRKCVFLSMALSLILTSSKGFAGRFEDFLDSPVWRFDEEGDYKVILNKRFTSSGVTYSNLFQGKLKNYPEVGEIECGLTLKNMYLKERKPKYTGSGYYFQLSKSLSRNAVISLKFYKSPTQEIEISGQTTFIRTPSETFARIVCFKIGEESDDIEEVRREFDKVKIKDFQDEILSKYFKLVSLEDDDEPSY
jgi:hypothetical protein